MRSCIFLSFKEHGTGLASGKHLQTLGEHKVGLKFLRAVFPAEVDFLRRTFPISSESWLKEEAKQEEAVSLNTCDFECNYLTSFTVEVENRKVTYKFLLLEIENVILSNHNYGIFTSLWDEMTHFTVFIRIYYY